MQAALDHLPENFRVYAGVFFLCLPFLLYFRRYTFPPIFYALEYAIYAGLMHFFTHGIVVLAAWFKDQSTMKRAFDRAPENANPGWTTPITDFWDKDLYTPEAIFWFECTVMVIIFWLMWRYRPLRVQKPIKAPMTKRTISRKITAQAMKPHSSMFRKK